MYCQNNPVNYIDTEGKSTAAFNWTRFMWWICAVDLQLPFGDIVYFGVMGILGANALGLSYGIIESSLTTEVSYAENNTDSSEKGEVTTENPPTESDGYRAPKGGPKKGKTKDGKTGWRDKNGNIWVPAPSGSPNAHGGGHWDVHRGDGKGYTNVYPGGKKRPGTGKAPVIPPIRDSLK